MSIRILIIDANDSIREEIRSILEEERDFIVIGAVKERRNAVDYLRKFTPDVVVMDLHMPEQGGIETVRQLLDVDHALKIIALSLYISIDLMRGVLKNGVSGYVLKDNILNELPSAVRMVMTGKQYISPQLSSGCE